MNLNKIKIILAIVIALPFILCFIVLKDSRSIEILGEIINKYK